MTPAQKRILDEVRAANAEGRPWTLRDRRTWPAVTILCEAGLVEPVRGGLYATVPRFDLKPSAATTRRVRMRKWMGDDRYSWAVFVDGRAYRSGESRDSASYERRRQIRRLAARAV